MNQTFKFGSKENSSMTTVKSVTPTLFLVLLPGLLLAQPQFPVAALAMVQQESQQDGQDDETSDRVEESGESKKSKRRSRIRKSGFRANSKQSEDFVSAFEPVVTSTCDAVVRIMNGKNQVALGTMLEKNGLILTKLSELKGQLQCKLSDGTTKKPTIVGIDPKTDLALLKVDVVDHPRANLEDLPMPPVGSWLATVDQELVPVAVGIVSHGLREIPSTELNSAVIGIYPEDIADADGVRINVVMLDSPAEKAGLLVNDVIIAIDSEKILNHLELLEKLSHFEPGDEIVLKVKRGDKEIDFDVTLGKRRINPMMERGNRQNRLGSTLSKRRDDFPLALQHDSTLNANQCGGPVVNLDGQVIGINIARDGRVSSLTLPNEIVIPIVNRLKSGKYMPNVVNKIEIKQLEEMLAKLTDDLGDLPDEKNQMALKQSAGNAVEKELAMQVEEAEERLEKLKKRLKEQKESNQQLGTALDDLEDKQRRIEMRREPLQRDLKRLKTGVQ